MADAVVSVSSGLFLKSNIDNKILKRNIAEIINTPKSIMVNKFNEESSAKFATDMSAAEETGQDIIPIYIDSYGGAVDSLLFMIDVIKASNKKIATIGLGKSMSCGVFLLSQGDEGYRFMSPTSRVMIHDVSTWAHGKVEEIKTDAAECDRLNKLCYKLMAIKTGHDEDYFMKLVHDKSHADWYLTAEEAKQHNIVNNIRIPKFNISISASIEFK